MIGLILYNAGLRKHPLAGFSRSVYHTLTGQKVPVTLTHLTGNPIIRSKEVLNKSLSIFPNPSHGDLVTIIMDNFNNNSQYNYTIHDLMRRLIYKGNISERETHLSLGFEAGMYFITITSDDQIIEVHKWTKTE